MTQSISKITPLIGLLTLLTVGAPPLGAAQGRSEMAPIEEYLLSEGRELALARSAAPPNVADAASYLVLTREGYQRVQDGSNGFVCLVNRSWTAAPSPEFWNPRTRVPVCHNPEAAKTILRYHQYRTELALAGKAMEEIDALSKLEFAGGRYRPPVAGAVSYMMSTAGYAVFPQFAGPVPPHVMVWTPYTGAEAWGGNPPFGNAPWVMGAGTALAVAIVRVSEGFDPRG